MITLFTNAIALQGVGGCNVGEQRDARPFRGVRFTYADKYMDFNQPNS